MYKLSHLSIVVIYVIEILKWVYTIKIINGIRVENVSIKEGWSVEEVCNG